MIQLLLSYHPDIEAKDAMGWTPLMVAGMSRLVNVLLVCLTRPHAR